MVDVDPARSIRLRAARLAAGHVFQTGIIEKLGAKRTTYRYAESAERNVGLDLMVGVAEATGVSLSFLVHGEVSTDADRRAASVETVLTSALAEGWTWTPSVSDRLRSAREAAGYATMRRFSDALGMGRWNYRVHECGTRHVGLDPLVHYGLALGADLGTIVLGRPTDSCIGRKEGVLEVQRISGGRVAATCGNSLPKSELVRRIVVEMERSRMSPEEASELFGMKPSTLRSILAGKVAGVGVDVLLDALLRLGVGATIVLESGADGSGSARVEVVERVRTDAAS